MKRLILPVTCLAAIILGASPGQAAGFAGRGHMSAPASIRAAPAVRHTSPATTARSFRSFHDRRHRLVIVDEFGFPFFPFWYPYWYGYYPYGYYPYSYYDYNRPVYGEPYGASGSIAVVVQQRLARAGYYHGAIDGVIGPQTRVAIRRYERAHGLRVDGVVSQQLITAMGLRG
jgi:Putative peptidoglycan binding domain